MFSVKLQDNLFLLDLAIGWEYKNNLMLTIGINRHCESVVLSRERNNSDVFNRAVQRAINNDLLEKRLRILHPTNIT